VDKVRDLLEQGATPNTQDHAGWSPLHEVAQSGNVEIMGLLIKHGADVNVASECKTTPIHDAVGVGHKAVIEVLLEAGANPSLKTDEGKSAIDMCTYSEEVKTLLQDAVKALQEKMLTETVSSAVPDKFVFLGSSLKGEDLQVFSKCATLLGGETCSKFSANVTHLLVPTDDHGNTQRTLKYLQCLSSGRWIVSIAWAYRCIQEGKWVDESPFEVTGCRQFANHNAPSRSRQNRKVGDPRLLKGFRVYFPPSDKVLVPSNDDLASMCEVLQAEVLKRAPSRDVTRLTPPHAKGIFKDHSDLVITSSTGCEVKAGALHISRDWLIDSISKYEIMNPASSS